MDPQQTSTPPQSEPSLPATVEPDVVATPSGGQRWPEWIRGYWDLRSLAIVILAALLAGLWIDTRSQLRDVQRDLARKLADADTANRESRQLSVQARDAQHDLEYRLAAMESKIAESQNQRVALEGLYLELNRSRDERVLAEVEQMLIIGSQQLTLAGNVKSALIALEAADSRLQRSDGAQFTAVRRAVRRDIERLKSTPFVDVVGMSLRLDNLAHEVDGFTLAMFERPVESKPVTVVSNEGAVRRFAREAWQDVQSLVRIQRVDRDELPLIAPSQAFFLRENLRLRLMSARIALLAHEQDSFKADTRESIAWMQRYFNGKDHQVSQALASLKQLSDADVNIDVPDIAGSLEEVRNAKLLRERGLR